MRTLIIISFCFILNSAIQSQYNSQSDIYRNDNRVRSGVAHGGIGTGSIELRKNGQFYNWSIFNNYPKGVGPIFKFSTFPNDASEESLLFFIVRYQIEGEEPKLKLLLLNQSLNEGGMEGIAYYYPWMTAIEQIEYSASFPFSKLIFNDSEMPLEITMNVYSPFIPFDVTNSTIPGIYFDFNIKSLCNKPVDVFIIATLRNLTGYDIFEKYFETDVYEEKDFKFFSLRTEGYDKQHPTYGNMGLGSLSTESTYYVGWEHKHPYYEKLLVSQKFANIDDTKNRNVTDKSTDKKRGYHSNGTQDQRLFGSIGISKIMNKNEDFEHTFIFTWNFPNAYGSYNSKDSSDIIEWNHNEDYFVSEKMTKVIGNYYTNNFANSFETAKYMIENFTRLSTDTKKFHSDFYSSTIDKFILDQINSNMNTFISSSTFTKDGKFAIREGMATDRSWGPNGTMDVSYYGSSMILALFPELQKSTMRLHKNVQTKNGEVAHGLAYDLDFIQSGTWGVYHRIDLPANYIQQVVRDYLWTNDKEYIKELYPSLKSAFYYILSNRDKDGDMMPDMEGIMCSYDNFPMYGLASYIQSQWVNAAYGLMKVSKIFDDNETYQKSKEVFESGINLMNDKLWNGEYFILSNDYHGEKGKDNGCLTDQLAGQWMAHQSGFGELFDKHKIKIALANILKMSYKKGFGLRNSTWPEYPDLFPIHESDLWVDQANTFWTGVELAFASFLLYEDMYEDALSLIKTVDDRYRKNGLYFDHQEFGGHYFRPMSAWSIINGLLGLSIQEEKISFSPCLDDKNYKVFFAFNNGTAFYIKSDKSIKIEILSGQMSIKDIVIEDIDIDAIKKIVLNNNTISSKFNKKENISTIEFNSSIKINSGSSLEIVFN